MSSRDGWVLNCLYVCSFVSLTCLWWKSRITGFDTVSGVWVLVMHIYDCVARARVCDVCVCMCALTYSMWCVHVCVHVCTYIRMWCVHVCTYIQYVVCACVCECAGNMNSACLYVYIACWWEFGASAAHCTLQYISHDQWIPLLILHVCRIVEQFVSQSLSLLSLPFPSSPSSLTPVVTPIHFISLLDPQAVWFRKWMVCSCVVYSTWLKIEDNCWFMFDTSTCA